MFVGVARYDLRLADCRSLKDKRSVLRMLETMLHQRFDVSVAEVDHQDLRQRAAMGVSLVAESNYHARKVLAEVGRHVETFPGVETIEAFVDVLVPER